MPGVVLLPNALELFPIVALFTLSGIDCMRTSWVVRVFLFTVEFRFLDGNCLVVAVLPADDFTPLPDPRGLDVGVSFREVNAASITLE